MRVIGNTLAARLLLLELHRNEVACEWLVAPEPPLPLGALALLPGPTLSLAQHSRNLWQQWATTLVLPLLEPMAFHDLATTPGRAVKLQEEALLDALAGNAVHYTPSPPYGLHPRLVQGARGEAAAPQLANDIYVQLDAQLAQHGISPLPLPPEVSGAWLQSRPTTLTDMQLAYRHCPHLGLQPGRQHRLEWALPQPLPAPAAPMLLLHRMPRGHTWLWITTTTLALHYDGAADPRQHINSQQPDDVSVAALTQHALQLLPLLGKIGTAAPQINAWATYTTPDGLPLLGNLTQETDLWLLGGMGPMDDLYAPALVEKLLEIWRLDERLESPLEPSRFAAMGKLEQRPVPESLQFTEPAAPVAAAPEIQRQATQIAPDVEVKRATEVRMVGKEITSGAGATMRGRNEKPKMQTSAVK